MREITDVYKVPLVFFEMWWYRMCGPLRGNIIYVSQPFIISVYRKLKCPHRASCSARYHLWPASCRFLRREPWVTCRSPGQRPAELSTNHSSQCSEVYSRSVYTEHTFLLQPPSVSPVHTQDWFHLFGKYCVKPWPFWDHQKRTWSVFSGSACWTFSPDSQTLRPYETLV